MGFIKNFNSRYALAQYIVRFAHHMELQAYTDRQTDRHTETICDPWRYPVHSTAPNITMAIEKSRE